MTYHRRRAIVAATISIATLGAVAAYARCTGGGGCPPPVNFPCAPTAFNPANPAASGYQVVFSDDFSSVGTSTIDLSATGNSGFHWYTILPFGYGTVPSSAFTTDSNGLIINPATKFGDGGTTMTTAYPNSSSANGEDWVGTAFGGGGYFVATFSFDEAAVNTAADYGNGHPAFWAMSVEHWANFGGDQWPGQAAGYTHYIEDDFFEYDNINGNPNFWGAAVVDWSGIFNTTCGTSPPPGYLAGAFCHIYNQAGFGGNNGVDTIAVSNVSRSLTWTPTTFHTIGALWVPGMPANSNIGYRKMYVDGGDAPAQSGASVIDNTTSWTDGTMPAPSGLPNSPELWSIHDQQNIVVNFGTHASQPMHIKSVQVWQIPGCGTVAH